MLQNETSNPFETFLFIKLLYYILYYLLTSFICQWDFLFYKSSFLVYWSAFSPTVFLILSNNSTTDIISIHPIIINVYCIDKLSKTNDAPNINIDDIKLSAILFAVEIFIAQPIARFVMKKMHEVQEKVVQNEC